MQRWIVESQDPPLNASLLLALLSPALIQDYKFQDNGIHCFFTRSIFYVHAMIKTFLKALYELTNKQFYFEVINDQEAILKIYGPDELQFSHEFLYDPSLSSKESANYDS